MDLRYEYSEVIPSWLHSTLKSVHSLHLIEVMIEIRFKRKSEGFCTHTESLLDLISGIPCHTKIQTDLIFTASKYIVDLQRTSDWVDSQLEKFREMHTVILDGGNIRFSNKVVEGYVP